MSEQTVDGVMGFTDEEGRRYTILVEATRGETDTRGRVRWDYTVKTYEAESGIDQFAGWIHIAPHYGKYFLLAQIFTSVHLKVLDRETDEYMARKATNND